MHLPTTTGVADDPDTEMFDNVIANIIQVVLVDAPDLISCKEFYSIRPLYSWIPNHPQISNIKFHFLC